MQRDVGELDLALVEPANAVEQRGRSFGADRDADPAVVGVDGGLAADARERLGGRTGLVALVDV